MRDTNVLYADIYISTENIFRYILKGKPDWAVGSNNAHAATTQWNVMTKSEQAESVCDHHIVSCSTSGTGHGMGSWYPVSPNLFRSISIVCLPGAVE